MKRRDFITLLGGVAVAWPLAAHAQQPERMRRIGVLMSTGADGSEGQARIAAFLHGLQQLGWADDRNIRIDIRWGAGDADRIRKYAAELVALAPDAILAVGGISLGPLLQPTHAVPIVFAIVADPVGAGFVDSLARPGGRATGFSMFEYSLSGKWPELLKEIAPDVTRAAVLRDTLITAGIGQFAVVQSVAPSVSLDLSPINVRGSIRDRAWSGGLCPLYAEWGSDRDGKPVDDVASRSDHRARVPPPPACRLSRAHVRKGGWFALVWPEFFRRVSARRRLRRSHSQRRQAC